LITNLFESLNNVFEHGTQIYKTTRNLFE